MKPTAFHPFDLETFRDLQNHVTQVRRLFDAPGAAYHDAGEPDAARFNRWFIHNPSVVVPLHHDTAFIDKVAAMVGEPVRPSYAFLSMYGHDGVCPQHSDRPQCRFTVDLLVNSNGSHPWPLEVADLQEDGEMREYPLEPGEALIYSGTATKHRRPPMNSEIVRANGDAVNYGTKADLVFFHFVPRAFVGSIG